MNRSEVQCLHLVGAPPQIEGSPATLSLSSLSAVSQRLTGTRLAGSAWPFSNGKGKVLSEEEIAAKKIYIQKMEKEKLEKLKHKSEKEKAQKDREDEQKVTRATAAEFPALNEEGVSIAVVQFPPSSLNPPHVNTRSTGFLFVISGMLEVELIDEKNKIFTQKLQTGDMFVFPKGPVHYQCNLDAKMNAVAVAVFGRTNAGMVSIPSSVFTTGIDVNVLAKAFDTDVLAVQKIEAGLTPNT